MAGTIASARLSVLDKANVLVVQLEALTANVELVLADETVLVSADAALTGTGTVFL
eukprot:CAMPEP_0170558568 /NCGR_PEP_ID=MMETSP0211-20121228/36241_1 /TAXON_ID=311385 /ORGANISM="Pseudokeronopsis sp., Strain OXSARD2" /LENGTH=55 /DNA_ID=CAMNT_0010870641 /DNA_START=184 /DNA_END=347 /DNA_ORIENTATION=+